MYIWEYIKDFILINKYYNTYNYDNDLYIEYIIEIINDY